MDESIGRFSAEVERPEPLKFAWPIVLIPELFTTARHLRVMLGYFATIGWEVIAPDLRACADDPVRVTFDEITALATEAIEALARDAVVVGHGAGGLVALRMAEHRRVRAGVAIAPLIPGVATNIRGGFFRRRKIRRTGLLIPPAGRVMFDFLADADAFAREVMISAMVPESDAMLDQIERGDIAIAPGVGRRLVIAGEADPFAPFERSAAFAESIGAVVVKVAGRGHWLVSGRALERVVNEAQRFLVKSLGQDLLLLYPEEWKEK